MWVLRTLLLRARTPHEVPSSGRKDTGGERLGRLDLEGTQAVLNKQREAGKGASPQ